VAVTGLFLRYCAPCNSTTTCAERGKAGLKCKDCGGSLRIVDARVLISTLGAKLDEGDREAVTADLQPHDQPAE
jgi:transcription initiation factor IIE alpha subunit